MYDPVSHLVYVTRGDDVQTTIVNGKSADAGPQGADPGRARRPVRRARLGGEGSQRRRVALEHTGYRLRTAPS